MTDAPSSAEPTEPEPTPTEPDRLPQVPGTMARLLARRARMSSLELLRSLRGGAR